MPEDLTEFPSKLIRKAHEDLSVQRHLKKNSLERSGHQPVAILGTDSDFCFRVAALLLRDVFQGSQQIEQVPMFSSLLLVQDFLEDYRATRNTFFGTRALVIVEQEIKVPFISRPDSWHLDRIHYGFTMITAAIDRRTHSFLETFFLVPVETKFGPTTVSLFAFFQETAAVKAIPWKSSQISS